MESISQYLQLPSVCIFCHHYHRSKLPVCSHCSALFTRLENPCQFCSMPLVDNQFTRCGYCIKKKPAFDQVITLYHYDSFLRTLLHAFKYQHALYLRTFLAQLMVAACKERHFQPGHLIPMPLHPKRIRARGFNQAAELTKELARHLNLSFDLYGCRKIINTASQVSLSGQQRRINLQGSFVVKPCRFRHITLIDDLITTGSTAHELAKMFKKQGVERVDLWCCARAIRDNDKDHSISTALETNKK